MVYRSSIFQIEYLFINRCKQKKNPKVFLCGQYSSFEYTHGSTITWCEKDYFWPPEEDKEIFGIEVSYLSDIITPMYLTDYTRLDIAFVVNLLGRFSFTPTKRHWNGVKHIFCYLHIITKIGLNI